MEVSQNGGTFKYLQIIHFRMEFSSLNHPFGGTPIFGKPQIAIEMRDRLIDHFRTSNKQARVGASKCYHHIFYVFLFISTCVDSIYIYI